MRSCWDAISRSMVQYSLFSIRCLGFVYPWNTKRLSLGARFKGVHAFQVELKFVSVGFCGGRKTSNKLNPHMASTPGIEPKTYWWEVSTHHECTRDPPKGVVWGRRGAGARHVPKRYPGTKCVGSCKGVTNRAPHLAS